MVGTTYHTIPLYSMVRERWRSGCENPNPKNRIVNEFNLARQELLMKQLEIVEDDFLYAVSIIER